jgi:hypothetical protein
MNGSKEQKKSNDEKINYAQQGAAESAQFLIAVAVGIFGILAMFLMINHGDMANKQSLNLDWGKGILVKGSWAIAEVTVLSIAYWALVLFGFQSYISRHMFEGLMGYHMRSIYPEWYDQDITKIAKENKLANWMVKRIWSSNYEKDDRYKGLWPVMILYFAITFSLWLFAAIF